MLVPKPREPEVVVEAKATARSSRRPLLPTKRSLLSKEPEPVNQNEPPPTVSVDTVAEATPEKASKRGRKPKQANVEASPPPRETQKEALKEVQPEEEKKKKRRGRKPKSFYENQPDKLKSAKKTSAAKPPQIYIDDILSDKEDDSEIEEDSDDEEFRLDKAESSVEDEVVSESSDDLDPKDIKIASKRKKIEQEAKSSGSMPAVKKYNTRRSTGKLPKTAATTRRQEIEPEVEPDEEKYDMDEEDTTIVLLDVFDVDFKIEKWEYELELESKAFRRPVLPGLSDEAIKPFTSSKSKPKCVLYECPFCKRIFTYTLVFKNHLFSCQANKNVPVYVLYCARHPECEFTGQKKQEMINHYARAHTGKSASVKKRSEAFVIDDEAEDESDSGSADDDASLTSANDSFKMTKTKQSQLEISQYSYVNLAELKFSITYLNSFLRSKFKRLELIDQFLSGSNKHDIMKSYNFFSIETHNLINNADKNALRFKLPSSSGGGKLINLRPFEFYLSDSFGLFNFAKQITAFDWCPMDPEQGHQVLAFSTLPFDNLERAVLKTSPNETHSERWEANNLLSIFTAPNLINFVKMSDLNNASSNDDTRIFSFFHREIGKRILFREGFYFRGFGRKNGTLKPLFYGKN